MASVKWVVLVTHTCGAALQSFDVFGRSLVRACDIDQRSIRDWQSYGRACRAPLQMLVLTYLRCTLGTVIAQPSYSAQRPVASALIVHLLSRMSGTEMPLPLCESLGGYQDLCGLQNFKPSAAEVKPEVCYVDLVELTQHFDVSTSSSIIVRYKAAVPAQH